MKKEDLLKYCRYYKGEKSPPKEIKSTFWNYEKKWIELSDEDNIHLDEMITIYVSKGLGRFEHDDNVPLTLKALLFNRYSHWNVNPNVNEFKQWYKTEYIKK